jgi:hypothetical protein
MTTASLHLMVATPIPADGSSVALVILVTMIVFAVLAMIRIVRRARVVILIDGKNVAFAVLTVVFFACLIAFSMF